MSITAQGAEILVVLNGSSVSSIYLDEWTVPGKRPDGSPHNLFKNVAVANLARIGYVGFQDLKGNCWFNQIRLKKLSPGGVSSGALATRNDKTAVPGALASSIEPYVETARFVGHRKWNSSVRLLADGKRLLTASADKTARLWEIATGHEICRLWHPDVALSAVALPDGRRAITGCYDGVVRLWDLQSGTLIRPLVKHGGAVHAIALSPDGTHALSGGQDKTLRMLDIARGSEVRQFEGIPAAVASVAFSRDGRRVLAGGDNGVVYLGNAMSSDPVRPLTGHSSVVWSVAFALDGGHAVSGAADGSMIYWDLDAMRALCKTRIDGADFRFAAFEGDGRHVIFSSPGGNKA